MLQVALTSGFNEHRSSERDRARFYPRAVSFPIETSRHQFILILALLMMMIKRECKELFHVNVKSLISHKITCFCKLWYTKSTWPELFFSNIVSISILWKKIDEILPFLRIKAARFVHTTYIIYNQAGDLKQGNKTLLKVRFWVFLFSN